MAVLISMASLFAYAQTPLDSLPGDPGGLYVYTTQNLSFGAFTHGNAGGTIIIGARANFQPLYPFKRAQPNIA